MDLMSCMPTTKPPSYKLNEMQEPTLSQPSRDSRGGSDFVILAPVDSGKHIGTYSSRRQQAFKLSMSQEFVYQDTSNFSLFFSIGFFSVFAEIALRFTFFSPVFGLQ